VKQLFIAVPLPAEARDEVVALVDGVRAGQTDTGVRWVRMDGLHLTVRFLGPTADERVDDVAAAVVQAAATARPFPIRISGAGAFPSPSRPRALWLGIGDGVEDLGAVARSLEAPLNAAGWPPDPRPFRAHLTLARTDGARGGPATVRALEAAASGFEVGFTADRLVLFESLTGRGPARYEPVSEAALAR
jgi:RNA 2',3'-cyclic 3'-phosphodiesterase